MSFAPHDPTRPLGCQCIYDPPCDPLYGDAHDCHRGDGFDRCDCPCHPDDDDDAAGESVTGKCSHVSRTPLGCDLCRIQELVRIHGAVGNGINDTYTSCPYCGAIVRGLGMPPTIYHALPECERYLSDVNGGRLQEYTDKLHAKIRGAGRE